jgi:bleomycin hydrolase
MKKIVILIITVLVISNINAQDNKDKSIFKLYQAGYYQNVIMKDVRNVEENSAPPKQVQRFKADLKGKDLPNKIDLYKTQWHNSPISQGNAGTCWSYSTISYFESEVFRLTNQKVKLSEIYIAYWEYVEKAREYIKTRGTSVFGEGSEANAVTRMFKLYGVIPYESYNGLNNCRKYHTHEKMKAEMDSYLNSVKISNAWNEEEVIATIKSIMNHYIGEPPTSVTVNGKQYTPKQYLSDVVKINPDDYIDILSIMQEPFYQKVLYDVDDNWWRSKDYYNVPLDEYTATLRKCIESGYTVAIGGDVSEAGFDSETQCAMVPSFDIPSSFINDEARQFRFSNKTTTDDHGIHIVGHVDYKGQRWYLIKDSGSGSRNNDVNAKEFGYYFFSEDYVKLKMMNFTVHKDAVKDLLKKFK